MKATWAELVSPAWAERMAQRHELMRLLGSHDPGELGCCEDSTLLHPPLFDQTESSGLHGDLAPGGRDPLGHRLVRYVNHVHPSLLVEMSGGRVAVSLAPGHLVRQRIGPLVLGMARVAPNPFPLDAAFGYQPVEDVPYGAALQFLG